MRYDIPYEMQQITVIKFLEHTVRRFGLPHECNADFPSKYEVVGDVLMIPEKSFQLASWEALPDKAPLWQGLAACFGLRRVALKAEIDAGAKRESRVSMLFNGDHADTWVTVNENGIRYSFDITKVMFCSGNCTERMRYASFNAEDQIVVDLYCGIGYYTLPLLIHGKAKFVHACELNPNSIAALKRNLELANIAPDRYEILEGDNRITTHSLRDVADRVSLGLLPTSREGWPIAVQVLKPVGGLLHIHENVHEEDIRSGEWMSSCLAYLRSEFATRGKPMDLEVLHIERVKSYAPRVYHFVADISCTSGGTQ